MIKGKRSNEQSAKVIVLDTLFDFALTFVVLHLQY